jgi:aladin
MSWDPSGHRLAVILDSAPAGSAEGVPAGAQSAAASGSGEKTGPHRPGRVVLYAMRMSPVVSASLLGYISAEVGEGVSGGSGAGLGVGGPARAAVLSGPGGGGGVLSSGGGGGSANGNGDGGGGGGGDAESTLAVCWEGGGVSVCPLYFPN